MNSWFKYWNTLALDGSNWQFIDLFEFQTDIKGSVVENLSKRCGGFLKTIELENCKWITDDAIKWVYPYRIQQISNEDLKAFGFF